MPTVRIHATGRGVPSTIALCQHWSSTPTVLVHRQDCANTTTGLLRADGWEMRVLCIPDHRTARSEVLVPTWVLQYFHNEYAELTYAGEEAPTAAAVWLQICPMAGMVPRPRAIPQSTQLQLLGCIVAVGQLVQVDWMGEPLQLKVHRLELECNGKTQEARIEPSTYFHVQEENNGKESVMLEDGEAPVGLVQAHTELRRFVRGILRLQAEGGTLHHCGLLVSGPHGSGKTNLVSQLLSALRPKEAAAVLDVSQLVSGDTSITASLAHRLVAKRLLVLEGLDVLAVQGSPSAEVVCGSIMQLLETLPPNLCIIGVTRDPGNLPTQLQSCHRLMGRLELRPPSRAARELIIRSLLTTTTYEATGSLADPEWTPCLRQVALKTPGWMPGDLCQLSRMAQLNALQDRGVKATVQPSDVQLALYQVTPEHVLSMPIQMPSATWDDFVGYQQEKEQAVQIVAGFFGGDVAVALRRLGACTAPAGLFLYGPSGCGKTMLANAIVDRFDANLVVLKVSDLLCQYLGETEVHWGQGHKLIFYYIR